MTFHRDGTASVRVGKGTAAALRALSEMTDEGTASLAVSDAVRDYFGRWTLRITPDGDRATAIGCHGLAVFSWGRFPTEDYGEFVARLMRRIAALGVGASVDVVHARDD